MGNIETSSSRYPDPELAAVERAAKSKTEVIASLMLALNARKSRGDNTDDLEEQIDIEQTSLAMFTRAADKRRRELRLFGTAAVRV